MLLHTVTGALLPRKFFEPVGTLSCRLRYNCSPLFRTRPVMNLIEVCSRSFRLGLVFVLMVAALSPVVQASPTSTLTLRLDPKDLPSIPSGWKTSSGEPLDEEVVAFRVRVAERHGSVERGLLIPELIQPRQPGIQNFFLSEIPVGEITVVLEGLNAEGEAVVIDVESFNLTSEPRTMTVATLIPRVEGVHHLGFGFRRLSLAEPSGVDFESIGHWDYLYYRNQRLCMLGDCSVSPSGNHVIFQDDERSGNLFLYRRADGQQTQLTNWLQDVATVKRFEWHENEGTVEVQFDTGLSEIYSIPAR